MPIATGPLAIGLEIFSHNIRLLAVKGRRVVSWSIEPLPAGAIKDGQIIQPEAIAVAVRAIFNRLKLPLSGVRAGFAGLSFTYRQLSIPAVKPSMLAEAIERVTQKEIHLPLNELYLDWHIIEKDIRKMEIFVAGVPRIQVDAMLHSLNLAGVNPSSIDLKPLALARAIDRPEALIVDFEDDTSNVVIVSHGRPVTLHTVTPRIEADIEDRLNQIRKELERTIDFYNITHKDAPIAAESPLFFSGEKASVPAIRDLFRDICGHPLKEADLRLESGPDFPLSSFVSTLGMLAVSRESDQADSNRDGAVFRAINLDFVKARKRLAKVSFEPKKLLLPLAALIAIGILIPMVILSVNAREETARLEAKTRLINRDLFLSQILAEEESETKLKIESLKSELAGESTEREVIAGQGCISDLVTTVANCLSEQVFCEGITADSDAITVDGSSGSKEAIIEFACSLEKTQQFADVRISNINELHAGAGLEFKLVLKR